MCVKKDLKEAKEQLMEQTIAVNHLTDTLSDFFESDFKVKWKKQRTDNIVNEDETILDNVREQNVTTAPLQDWSTVIRIMDVCIMENYIFLYHDNDVEEVYEQTEKKHKHEEEKINCYKNLYHIINV